MQKNVRGCEMQRLGRYLFPVIAILMLMAYGIGCAGTNGGQVTDYVSLVDNLRAAGATVESAGDISQPFFSVTGSIIVVNGGDAQVFEYENATVANEEAALVSTDGSSVGTTMTNLVEPSHFYKAGRLIVLYVGESESVIRMLQDVLGPQFAGK